MLYISTTTPFRAGAACKRTKAQTKRRPQQPIGQRCTISGALDHALVRSTRRLCRTRIARYTRDSIDYYFSFIVRWSTVSRKPSRFNNRASRHAKKTNTYNDSQPHLNVTVLLVCRYSTYYQGTRRTMLTSTGQGCRLLHRKGTSTCPTPCPMKHAHSPVLGCTPTMATRRVCLPFRKEP